MDGYIKRSESLFGINNHLRQTILNQYKQSDHEIQLEKDIALRLSTLNEKH